MQHSLARGQPYYFWLEIGAPVEGSATRARVELPIEQLPTDAELDVFLFASGGGFVVPVEGGRIRVASDEIGVTHPLARPTVSSELLARRLFFPVIAPRASGQHHLWCCIYHQDVLIQSHDITVVVTARRRDLGRRSIESRMDYTLSTRLELGSFAGFGAHRLSIASNSGPTGSHGFWFTAGRGELRRGASFDGHEVQDLIDRACRAFRMVSWGTTAPWQPGSAYRYERSATLAQLTADLARLAIAGFRNYDAMIERLGGDDQLGELMRRPGTIQLALKESARFVLPIALCYDHRLDVDAAPEQYSLCPQFVRSTDDLEHHPCFLGDCPNRDLAGNRTVCPSGFWGFRHEIGVPPTLGTGAGAPEDLPAVLVCPGVPTVVVAISTDPRMRERDDHIRNLKGLLGAPAPAVAESRSATLALLRSARAHLVYFYCHGGVDDDVPYLQIGALEERLSRATLRSERIRWTEPRALVFMNGCYTADLEPERAIDLVTGFIQTARASGVIGTEITVFEPLATAFAEAFFARLLERRPVGAAVRLARLRLLKDWNPLGLLYVPFAMATLRLSSGVASATASQSPFPRRDAPPRGPHSSGTA